MYQIHLLNLILLLPYNNYTHETFNFDFLLYPLDHNIIIVKLKSRFLQLLQTSLHVFVLIMKWSDNSSPSSLIYQREGGMS